MSVSVTANYHEPGSKWHLAPNFSNVMLSENDTIEYAINLILAAKNKHLIESEKKNLINAVELFVNGTTVSSFNKLSDLEWNELDCLPLICKIYLKHLLCQTQQHQQLQSSKQKLLENDFNFGLKIDWKNNVEINNKIQQMRQCGFDYDDCCEAIIVTENQSIAKAMDYILLDGKAKEIEYNKMKHKLNRFRVNNKLRDNEYDELYVNKFNTKQKLLINKSTNDLEKEWRVKLQKVNKNKHIDIKDKNNEILSEIDKYKQIANDLQRKRVELREKLNRIKQENKLILYENYVKGILSENSLNIEQVTEWKRYRDKYGITDIEHNLILNKFGYQNDNDLDKMKTYINNNSNDNDNDEQMTGPSIKESVTTRAPTSHSSECVICYSSLFASASDTGYMLLPCNHICLCENCINEYYSEPHENQKCPLDCKQVIDVKKVYFS